MQSPEQLAHFGQLIPCLKATWIGEQPKPGLAEYLWLLSDQRVRSAKRRAIGLEAEHGDAARLQSPDLHLERVGTSPQLLLVELTGRRRHPVDQVRDADAERGQSALLRRRKDMIGEPSCMQYLPKSVSRAGEMLAQLTRESPRIDAAKENGQIRPNQVRYRSRHHGPCNVASAHTQAPN